MAESRPSEDRDSKVEALKDSEEPRRLRISSFIEICRPAEGDPAIARATRGETVAVLRLEQARARKHLKKIIGVVKKEEFVSNFPSVNFGIPKFIGLLRYYRRSYEGYSNIAKPKTSSLKRRSSLSGVTNKKQSVPDIEAEVEFGRCVDAKGKRLFPNASRQLKIQEKNYTTTLSELGAVWFRSEMIWSTNL
ncbi:hypothetical protein Tco_1263047 [Tanacetum coccineum]